MNVVLRLVLALVACVTCYVVVANLHPELVVDISQSAPMAVPRAFLRFNRPLIIAHRGSRYMNPENTLPAFDGAFLSGADVIETDVQLTRDGVLVIMHDHVLNRTTNGGDGTTIGAMTVSELKALDAAHYFSLDGGHTYPLRGAGVQIPTLKEVLERYPGQAFNIEIKDDDRETAEALHRELVQLGGAAVTERVVVSSRWCDALQHFRSIGGKAGPTAFTTSACEGEIVRFVVLAYAKLMLPLAPFLSTTSLTGAGGLGYSALQIPVQSGPFNLAADLVRSTATTLGAQLHYWVLNEEHRIERLLAFGADGIVTDRPDVVRKVMERMGLMGADADTVVVVDEDDVEGERLWKAMCDHPACVVEEGASFIPEDQVEEVHTCISLGCRVGILLMGHSQLALALVGALFVLVLLWCTCTTRAAAAGRAPAAAGKWKQN